MRRPRKHTGLRPIFFAQRPLASASVSSLVAEAATVEHGQSHLRRRQARFTLPGRMNLGARALATD